MQSRRTFIQQTTWLLGAAGMAPSTGVLAAPAQEKLVLLHTNDVHSRLDPFPMDGSRNQGLGGVAQRMQLIKQIRNENKHVLLLDAGDIFQGTPYFNFFKGEPEMKAMSAMGYDAATMGNHDFDGGIDNFAKQLEHANFPVIISNYKFTATSMQGNYKPYQIFKKGRIRIGVFGLGIELEGLVPKSLYQQTIYHSPQDVADEMALHLRKYEKCDLIICLSHLGFDYGKNPKISDVSLAAASADIDIIIGGHTHTFLNEPRVVANKAGRQVIINQVGWGGIYLGRIDIEFTDVHKQKFAGTVNMVVEQKS